MHVQDMTNNVHLLVAKLHVATLETEKVRQRDICITHVYIHVRRESNDIYCYMKINDYLLMYGRVHICCPRSAYKITLSRATEQYCAAGAILKPLCLSKQFTLYSQQHIDQLFPGHIV